MARFSMLFTMLLAALLTHALIGEIYSDKRENWAIGIYGGGSPFSLSDAAPNPVLSADDVTDADAAFVADPFIVRSNGTWFMFFEIYDKAAGKGDIALAESKDGRSWEYKGIVLKEPFHLSYPHVFEWQGAYYMVPESKDNKSVRLYRADNFPEGWSYAGTLLNGSYFDSTLFFHNGTWWMFTTDRNDMLYLFCADGLYGPWQAHPKNPIVRHNASMARPGGRIIWYNGTPVRFAQDGSQYYGKGVRAFAITVLNRTDYSDGPVPQNPILGTGSGWNSKGMHHMDAHETEDGWIAAVDGHSWEMPFFQG